MGSNNYLQGRTDMKRFGFAGLMFVVLLFGAQVVSAEGWPGCPWGRTYDAIANGYVGDCFAVPTATSQAAAKPAGLAQPAPMSGSNEDWWFAREGYDQGSFSEAPAVAASKPAGLAQPAP
jgi:hypothetical protein